MRRITVLTCSLAIALAAGTALAQTSSAGTKPAQTAKSHPAANTTIRANGKMSAFDESTGMLTLTNGKKSQQFMIVDATKIQEGSKSIDKMALAKLTGHEVTVSYTEASGQKTVQSVHVSNSGSGSKKS